MAPEPSTPVHPARILVGVLLFVIILGSVFTVAIWQKRGVSPRSGYAQSFQPPVKTPVTTPVALYRQFASAQDRFQATQRLLSALGYEIGSVDGVFGPRTKDALNAFVRNYGSSALTPSCRQLLVRPEAVTDDCVLLGLSHVVSSGGWPLNGQGNYKWSDARYTGSWLDGVRHGHGEMRWSDGDNYSGEWANNEQHGQG